MDAGHNGLELHRISRPRIGDEYLGNPDYLDLFFVYAALSILKRSAMPKKQIIESVKIGSGRNCLDSAEATS